jgi:AmmeMemoRadiSam system protein A
MLSETDRTFLLATARNSLASAVLHTSFLPAAAPSGAVNEPRGAFVTLHMAGELRGCIGYVDALRPLLVTVEHAARMAGTQDARFARVSADELPFIDIEISVLSPAEVFHAPEEIEIGTHGVLLETRHQRGLLLPQVALEQGWNQIMLLEHTAEKAGLPRHSWQLPGVTLYRFTAEIFHECAPSTQSR